MLGTSDALILVGAREEEEEEKRVGGHLPYIFSIFRWPPLLLSKNLTVEFLSFANNVAPACCASVLR